MIKKILDIYATIFGRRQFYKFNKMLYFLGLRGLGILNFKHDNVTKDEIKWLNSYIPKLRNPIVFDIGANVGEYSKTLLKLNNSSVIYAFEPHPNTFQKLSLSIDSSQVKLFNVAVGKEVGKMKLYDYKDSDGSVFASVYKDVIEVLHDWKSVSYDINVITLNDIAKEYLINNIDLLKIDTEGHELQVLLGAINLIKNGKIKAIHLEFNEMNIISKSTFKDFWDLLYDYNIYRLLPDGSLLEIKTYEAINCEIYAYQNIIAIFKEL